MHVRRCAIMRILVYQSNFRQQRNDKFWDKIYKIFLASWVVRGDEVVMSLEGKTSFMSI